MTTETVEIQFSEVPFKVERAARAPREPKVNPWTIALKDVPDGQPFKVTVAEGSEKATLASVRVGVKALGRGLRKQVILFGQDHVEAPTVKGTVVLKMVLGAKRAVAEPTAP